MAAATVPAVAQYLLEDAGYKYVLPYKMSQDHLELHFGRVRRMGGLNNNPNAIQLRQAMRRLVLHNFITPSLAGNCMAQDADDDDGLLIHRPAKRRRQDDDGDTNDVPEVVTRMLQSHSATSPFVQNCAAYIAGYVCLKVVSERCVRCGECVGALVELVNKTHLR